MFIKLVMPSNHLILCCPLLLLPSIFPSIRVFSKESAIYIRWPKYWSFSFNIGPSNEHSGLMIFRMDWLDRLAVQGTLKSLLQKHQFFGVQPSLWSNSHIHMWLLEKTVALTIQTFVDKLVRLLKKNFYYYYYYYFLIYNIVLVLPYINMNLQWVYTCS